MDHFLLLALGGLLAGAMNALAGGGSFVSLPAMIAAGVPSVQANASGTVALFPGQVSSAWSYWDGMRPVCKVPRQHLIAVSVVGGLIGSLLLLWTPSRAFDFILPWLMLVATLALAFGRQIGLVLQRYVLIGPRVMLIGQFVLGIYGGYYGGAIGLMMLALWALVGEHDIKSLNPPRIMLASASNVAAVATFIIAGAVRWPQTLIMLVGGVIGGYGGARLGRVLPGPVIRALTIAAATAITIAFFIRAYR
ncbi:MAG: TSUP family transporter [Methylobacteriaceae bacterium]|nr:TSUP family transporter [Methylobacteriaceae bacterium]